MIARHCCNILGDRLIVAPIQDEREFYSPLPSPEELRNKVSHSAVFAAAALLLRPSLPSPPPPSIPTR